MTTAKQILTHRGLQETHWGNRIIAAESGDGFSDKDIDDADDWTVCACGKQDARLMDELGEPKDFDLLCLGIEFARNVGNGSFVQSALTLANIEKRAAVLIAEIEQ